MRVVITGASGNVGTALLRRLRAQHPDSELVGVVRRPPEPNPPYDDVDWHSVDLSADTAASELVSIFRNADAVVHLAWGFQPTRNRAYLNRVGVGGTAHVLDAADRTAVPHLIHMSSVGAYAPGAYGVRVDESWPTTGISTSAYSRDKADAEALLDRYEARQRPMVITRMRPGFIVQRDAANGLARYGLPAYVPHQLLHMIPVLPIDRGLCLPLIHADDVASAFVGALDERAHGAFNLAGEPPVTRDDIADVLGARPVHIPSGVLGALVDASWRARLQRIDRGWLDLAFAVPLLDTDRARSELDWTPQHDTTAALRELIDGFTADASLPSPPLRARSWPAELAAILRGHPATTRHIP